MLLLAGLLKKRIAKAYLFVIVLCLSLPILPTCAQQRQGMFMDYQNQMAHLGRHINKVHQGKFGYLFIATNNGLVRFDGYRYQTIYRTAQGLTDNQVADVLEDRTGMLWVAGRHQGISQLNPSTGSWKRWPLLWPSKLGSQEIRKILLDTRGTLWLATQAGLGRYWAAKDSFLLHPLPDSNWHATGVKDIALDTQGNLWVLTAQMLYRFNITTHQWERFGATTHYQNQAITAWKSLSADSSGQLYLVSWSQGFYRFAAPWQSLEPLPERLTNDGSSIKGYAAEEVVCLPDGQVWIACGHGGLLCYDANNRSMQRLYPQKRQEDQAAPYVLSISPTPQAGIWIGTENNLLQTHPAFTRLHSRLPITPRTGETNLYLSELAWDATTGQHLLACSGQAGMILANADFTRMTQIPDATIPDKGFADVGRHPDGQWLALAYQTGKLYSVNLPNKTMQPYRISTIEGVPKCLETDILGRLWIATHTTLYCLGGAGALPQKFELPDSTPNARPQTFYLRTDAQSRAWLGTNHGLYRIDANTHTIDRVPLITSHNEGMVSAWVRSMAIDAKNAVWVGYDGQGLQRIDGNSLVATNTWEASSLPAAVVNSLAIGTKPQLLAATTKGLCALKDINNGWELYGYEDGLDETYLDQNIAVSPTGKVLVNLRNKIQVFDEAVLNQPIMPLPLNLHEILINNQPYLATRSNLLELPYHKNNIQIKFAAHHWLYPLATTYYYRFGKNKPETDLLMLDQPNLLLPALRPGKYTLQLLAKGAGGSLSPPYELMIVIHPPFWWRWWFIVLMSATAASLLYILYRWRLKQLLATRQVRYTISQNLHDDIGSSLSNIQILNELARRNLNKEAVARGYLGKAAEDLQQVSEALSDIVWNVNPRYDDLQNLLIRMRRYAAELLDGKDIDHSLSFPDGPLTQHMPMEQRRDFYLIFKEALHNLIKYAQASKATIEITLDGRSIKMQITDNGVGFNPAQASHGNGLRNMHLRAAQWQGQLTIQSHPGCGTHIILTLPLAT